MIKKISQTYERIKKNKDGRVLIANFGYLSLLQIASYVFPLITIPYLARVIGVDSFGKIAFASAVIVWVKAITDWGFNYTATRDVARNRDDKEKVSDIFSNVLWAKVLLMVLSFVLLLVAIYLIPQFGENSTILLITFLLIPGRILFPEWFFQAIERMKYITILNVLSKLIFTLLVFVFIKKKSDFILQPLFTTLGYIVSGVVTFYIITVRWKIKINKPSLHSVFLTIKSSTDVFINNLMPNLYNSFSTILLGFWGGNVSNGLLDAGGKFVGISQQFMNIFSRTFFPFLSRRIDKHKIYLKLNIFFALFFTIVLFLTAPLLIKLFFTEEFYSAVIVLQIMSLSVLFLSLSNVYGTNYMIIRGYERELRNITFISSVIGFLLSFPLIYFFDYVGAAITVTLTRGLLGISIMINAKKISNENIPFSKKNSIVLFSINSFCEK